VILDVGCGKNKYPGAIGIDRNPDTAADVICDLDRVPYPFRGGRFDEVHVTHVIEHVYDVMATMEELHRLTRPGGRIVVETPHYTDFSSFCDPTHRWHLNSFSFRYFGERNGGFGYYTRARMREVRVTVKLPRLWKWLGFQFAVNRSLAFRKFWEHYLCYVVRGKVIVFELEVLKANEAAAAVT
jgi:SAM-dependent methyltransferase